MGASSEAYRLHQEREEYAREYAAELLIAAKDAAITLAQVIEAARGDPRKSPCLRRLMAAIASAEGR